VPFPTLVSLSVSACTICGGIIELFDITLYTYALLETKSDREGNEMLQDLEIEACYSGLKVVPQVSLPTEVSYHTKLCLWLWSMLRVELATF
jgi:hypothetical protein